MELLSNVNWVSVVFIVFYVGENFYWIMQGDIYWIVVDIVSFVVGKVVMLFVYDGGIQVFVGNGLVFLQVYIDVLEILVDKDVSVISVNEGIEIKVCQKIVLQVGQVLVMLEGGNIMFVCLGMFLVKGVMYVFLGGVSVLLDLMVLLDIKYKFFDEVFVVKDLNGNLFFDVFY